MPIEYMFSFIWGEQCIKIISSRNKCDLFYSIFKNIIPNNTTPSGWGNLTPHILSMA